MYIYAVLWSFDHCGTIIRFLLVFSLSCEFSNGSVVGADGLGKRGIDSYEVGRKAGEELRKVLQSDSCFDPYSQVFNFIQNHVILYSVFQQNGKI